jgi:hypothetical protein
MYWIRVLRALKLMAGERTFKKKNKKGGGNVNLMDNIKK